MRWRGPWRTCSGRWPACGPPNDGTLNAALPPARQATRSLNPARPRLAVPDSSPGIEAPAPIALGGPGGCGGGA